jgi:lipid A 3-O-deacylase
VTVKFSAFIASASLLLLCSVSTVALADGMPFEPAKPQQNLVPIDQSLSAQPPASAATAAAPAASAPLPPPEPESRLVAVQPDTSFFGMSIGMFDPAASDSKSSAFNVEWQPGVRILGTLQPLFGAMATTRGALLGYAGMGVPFNITDHVFVMPSFSIGGYKHGSDYDLGKKIVERPGVEIAYQFDDKSRLGLSFDVLTAGTSLQSRARAEMVSLTYTMPLNTLSGAPDASTMTTTTSSTVTATPAPSPVAAPPASMLAPAASPSAAKPLPHELP